MKKKILMVTNNPPHNLTAGGILYDQIATSYGIEHISFVSVSGQIGLTTVASRYLDRPIKQFAIRLPNRNILWKIIKKIPFVELIFMQIKYNSVKNKVLEFARNENCELIFAALRGDVLLVLEDLMDDLQLPVVSMIEDTVEREIDDHYMLYKRKKKQYYRLLSKIQGVGVPSESMKEFIDKNFKLEVTILRPWFACPSNRTTIFNIHSLNIFFAGNIYAKKEFFSFLNALDSYADKNSGIKISFFVATHGKIGYHAKNFSITNIGWVNEKILNKYMKISHISYLPYKSELKFLHSMKYAFPGKAGLYIANRLPIFFHGPVYSSFNVFLRKYKIGVSCDTFRIPDIGLVLDGLIRDSNKFSQFQNECSRAYENEFSESLFNSRVVKLLDNI